MLLRSILASKINPIVLIPALEELLEMERLNLESHMALNDDRRCIKSERLISQLELLICLLRFKSELPLQFKDPGFQ
jgi:hypothetical protein